MRLRLRTIPSLTAALLLAAAEGTPQEAQPSEYQLKAAFIYNFAQFVEWPPAAFAEATSPLVIGVLGESPFGGALEQTVRGKALQAHPLIIKAFRSPAEATNNCHVLFISASEKRRLGEIVAGLRGTSVLTVGETEGFIEAGGMINFIQHGKKIRFQINNQAAKSAGLKVSSKLLSLASQPAR